MFARFRNADGNVAVMFGLSAVAMIAAGGVAVDMGSVMVTRQSISGELDAAALAAVRIFIETPDGTEAEIGPKIRKLIKAQLHKLKRRKKLAGKFSYTYSVDYKRKYVTVNGKLVSKLSFGKLFGHHKVQTSLRVVAGAISETEPVCMIAVNDGNSPGIEFVGSGELKALSCVVWSNSTGPQSIRFDGRGKVEAERICANGRVGRSGQFSITPAPQERCGRVDDPLLRWTPPDVGKCDSDTKDWIEEDTVELDPGVYCQGLRVNAREIKLKPGVFIIKDGPLILRGKSMIRGDNVGIYLTGKDVYVDLDGDTHVEINADKSGPLAGIAIATDRDTVKDGKSIISGLSDLRIGGVLYFPTQEMTYWGESETRAASPVTTIIAGRLKIGGNAFLRVKNNRDEAKYAPIVETAKGSVFLVE